MADLVWVILRIVGTPIVLFTALYFMLLGQVWGQKSSGARLELIDPKDHQDKFGRVSEHNLWAESQGFQWLGAYRYVAPFNPRNFITCWRRASDGVIALCYTVGRDQVFDFVTAYVGNLSLTTNSTPAAMLYPQMPGLYKQAFPYATLEVVLRRHSEGDAFLRKKFRLRPAAPEPIETLFVRSVATKARRVWKIWLFPIRSLYWYFLMNKKAGVPVSKQDLLPPDASPAG